MRINLRKVTRDPGKEITPYRELSEVDDGNAHTVNEQTGYHVVGEDISVIFYSDTYHGELASGLVKLNFGFYQQSSDCISIHR